MGSFNPDSFTARIVAATVVGDEASASNLTGQAMRASVESLLRLIEQQPKEDLPFWLASMRILSTSMLNILPDSGKNMVENLCKLTSAVVIEKNAFMQQLHQEEESL